MFLNFLLMLFTLLVILKKNKQFFTGNYKILKIKNWYGRLGNNIITIACALHIAIEEGYHAIIFPEHPFFSKTYIKLKKCNLNTKNIIEFTGKEIYFYNNENKKNQNILKKNREKVLKYLTDLFKIKYENIPKMKNNDLYIHIRSGDIINDKNECRDDNYCANQPKFEFYKNIIDNNNYDDIFIISEDLKNPIINKLLKEYPNIKHSKNSLEEDIKLIMGCKNIIHSYTTFVPTLLYFNKEIKKVYRNKYVDLRSYGIINLIKYNKYNEIIS